MGKRACRSFAGWATPPLSVITVVLQGTTTQLRPSSLLIWTHLARM